MNRFLRLVFSTLLVAMLGANSVFAYPIFIACNADGTLRETLSTRDIQAAVLLATDPSALDRKLTEICAGKADCFAILKQAFLLTQSSIEIANDLFEREVEKLEAKADELNEQIDPSLSATAKNLVSMSNEIYACRKAQEGLEWGHTVYGRQTDRNSGAGLKVFMSHRVDNEYRFVSGKTDYEAMRRVIWKAVALGLDPYAALAVSYLESGKVEEFVLDPAPAMEMMGCPLEKLKVVNDSDQAQVDAVAQSMSGPFIYSWGTFYGVKYKTSTNQVLYDMMKNNKASLNPEMGNDPGKPALACFNQEGPFLADEKSGEILWNQLEDPGAASVREACCVRIPYASYTFFYALANRFVKDKLNASGKPEEILQSFNGRTKLMGITEKKGVGAFRLGINTKTDPQYGYQGMDFILNSFMSNPVIRSEIADAEKFTGKKPKSLLCIGKGTTPYAIDSDYYLKKSKQTVRFAELAGKSWDGMTPLQKSLMRHEWTLMADAGSKRNPKHTDAEYADYQAKLRAFASQSSDASKWAYYQQNLYPYRKTLYQTSMKSWSRLSDDDVRRHRAQILLE